MTNKVSQQRRFHLLVRQAGLSDAEKTALLDPFGVESSKDLTAEQLAEICDALQRDIDAMRNPAPAIRRKRSKVLDLLTQLGIYKPGGSWAPVNQFLEQPRIAGKRLYLLDEAELKTLIDKLHAFLRRRQKEQEKENQTAPFN